MKRLLHLILIFAFALSAPALAVNPDEILDDPVLEARARELSKDLRCVVCRNQSIDDSNAGIARDMRIVLRERLVAGDSNQQALDFLVDRYGSYVLLNPPVNPATYLLWGGPALLLLLAVFGFSRLWRRRAEVDEPEEEMSTEDAALLKSILEEDQPS